MYGKKRIKIEKNGTIVLAGDKSYIPIGKYFSIEETIVGKICKVENYFDRRLDENNSIDFKFKTVSELRQFVNKIYSTKLNTNEKVQIRS